MAAVAPNQGTIFTSPYGCKMTGLAMVGAVTSHTQIRIVLNSFTYKCQMPERKLGYLLLEDNEVIIVLIMTLLEQELSMNM